jgi:hypothetical protein
MDDLAAVLKDVEPEQVKEFCRGLLKDESPDTEQAQSDAENGTTPAGTTRFVFVGAHDQPWPESHGRSRREQQIAARKGASDA